MSLRFVGVAVFALGAAVAIGWGIGQSRSKPPVPETASNASRETKGALLFQVYCASCHGSEGHGDGPSAIALRPPPRAFASRPWRTEVTEAAIRKVIVEGLPGSAMPANPSLPTSDVNALTAYVLQLATTTPPVVSDSTPERELLKQAGFVDVRGTVTPALSVVDAQARTVRLADLKGKLVLVHFWGTNCAHCLKEFPHLKALEAEFADRGLVALHICTDADDLAEAQTLADRHAPGLRVMADDTGLAMARFEVQALPTIWLIDPQGNAVGRATGARDWRDTRLKQLFEHLLPKGPAR